MPPLQRAVSPGMLRIVEHRDRQVEAAARALWLSQYDELPNDGFEWHLARQMAIAALDAADRVVHLHECLVSLVGSETCTCNDSGVW